MDGRVLHFYLAGINDQNFLMRDRETGSWWQQITGTAIAGPLRGAHLRLLSTEEISYGLWRREYPLGTVLAPVAGDQKNYVRPGWVKRYHKYPTVIGVPRGPLKPRSLVIGVALDGQARVYPYRGVIKQQVIEDRIGNTPVLVALGPDGRTVRVFVRRAPGLGHSPQFFKEVAGKTPAAKSPARRNKTAQKPVRVVKTAARIPTAHKSAVKGKTTAGKAKPDAKAKPEKPVFKLQPWVLIDAASGSVWNFRGCAVAGKEKGQCLTMLPSINEDWFDWHHYHPATVVFKEPGLPVKAPSHHAKK